MFRNPNGAEFDLDKLMKAQAAAESSRIELALKRSQLAQQQDWAAQPPPLMSSSSSSSSTMSSVLFPDTGVSLSDGADRIVDRTQPVFNPFFESEAEVAEESAMVFGPSDSVLIPAFSSSSSSSFIAPSKDVEPEANAEPTSPLGESPAPAKESGATRAPPSSTGPSRPSTRQKPVVKQRHSRITYVIVYILVLGFFAWGGVSLVHWFNRIESTKGRIDRITVVPPSKIPDFLRHAERTPGSARAFADLFGFKNVVFELKNAPPAGLNASEVDPVHATVLLKGGVDLNSPECQDLNGDGNPDCLEVAAYKEKIKYQFRQQDVIEDLVQDGQEVDEDDLTPMRRRQLDAERQVQKQASIKDGRSETRRKYDEMVRQHRELQQQVINAHEADMKRKQELDVFSRKVASIKPFLLDEICGQFNQYDPNKGLIVPRRSCWDIIEMILTHSYAPSVYNENLIQLGKENPVLAALTAASTAAMPGGKLATDFSDQNQCLCSHQLGFLEYFVFACDGNPQTCTLFIEPTLSEANVKDNKYIGSTLVYDANTEPRLRATTHQINAYFEVDEDGVRLEHPVMLNVSYYTLPSRADVSAVVQKPFDWAYSAQQHLDSRVQKHKRIVKGYSDGFWEWFFDYFRSWSVPELNQREVYKEISIERDRVLNSKAGVGKSWETAYERILQAKTKAGGSAKTAQHGGGANSAAQTTAEANKPASRWVDWRGLGSAIVSTTTGAISEVISDAVDGGSRILWSEAPEDHRPLDDAAKDALNPELTEEDRVCRRFHRDVTAQGIGYVNETLISVAIDYGVTRACINRLFDWPRLKLKRHNVVSNFKAKCLVQWDRYHRLVTLGQLRHVVDSIQRTGSVTKDADAVERFEIAWASESLHLRSRKAFNP